MQGTMYHRFLLIRALLMPAASAYALSAAEAKAIAIGDGNARIEALRAAIGGADAKTLAYIQALSEDLVKVVAERPVVLRDGKLTDPVTGAEVNALDAAE
ncbi:MAG: urea ABC transporter permease subunit UrtB, partial [Rhodoferax sp.]